MNNLITNRQVLNIFMNVSQEEKQEIFYFSNSNNNICIFIFNNSITLRNYYFDCFHNKVSTLFKKAITNLLNTRRHLALQLDHEYGNISDEDFAREEECCLLEEEKIPFDELKSEIDMLFRFSNMPLDSEEISNILNCPVEDAEKAIKHTLSLNYG